MDSLFNNLMDKPEPLELEEIILGEFLDKLNDCDINLDQDFKAIMVDYLERCSIDGPILD